MKNGFWFCFFHFFFFFLSFSSHAVFFFFTFSDFLFVFGGTGGNVLALASLLETGEAVLATDTSHIHVDEAGAPERLIGTKIVTVPHSDGKLTVEDVEACVADRAQVHHPRVGVVSITQVTEMGTVYKPDEVAHIAEACHRRGLRLHMDLSLIHI